MEVPARMPKIYQYAAASNRAVQKDPISDGSNSFLANALVYITAGALAAVPTDGVLCYGMTPDPSHGATDKWPEGAPFGEMHYPFDLNDVILAVQLTNDANDFGASGPTWTSSSLAVGNKYGILTPTTGDRTGMQFLNYQETTATLFEVVGLHPDYAVGDNNPVILVKVLATKLQVA